MSLFKPEAGEGFRELITPIQPRTFRLDDYQPADVVRILASLWGYPATKYDTQRLLKGNPAEIVCYKEADVPAELSLLNRPVGDKVRYLHGCDIAYYRPGSFLEMLQHDRCFLSLDPLSIADSYSCLRAESDQGLFVVLQLRSRPFPKWSADHWKSFGCEARPHIQFQSH